MKQQNPKKHFQDVYQVMKCCMERYKLFFVSENKVERLGEIINLLETPYLRFKMHVDITTACNYHHWKTLSWVFWTKYLHFNIYFVAIDIHVWISMYKWKMNSWSISKNSRIWRIRLPPANKMTLLVQTLNEEESEEYFTLL